MLRRQLQTCLSRHKTFSPVSVGINVCGISSSNRHFCTSGHGEPKKSFQDTLSKMKRDSEDTDAIVPPAPGSTTAASGVEVNTKAVPGADGDVDNEGSDSKAEDAEKKEDSDDDTSAEGDVDAKKEGEEPPSSFNFGTFFSKISDMSRGTMNSVSDMFKEKPKSVLEYEVEKSYLRRKIHQALTFTQTAEAPQEGEDGYDGPREMVWIKDPLSPWDSMKARMAQSPLIKDLLKRSFKVSQAVSETQAGKKLGVAGQAIQDKIDVRLIVC
mgnify:FL=1